MLAVEGPELIGKGAIISKALSYTIDRIQNLFRGGIFTVDLQDKKKIEQVIVKIS